MRTTPATTSPPSPPGPVDRADELRERCRQLADGERTRRVELAEAISRFLQARGPQQLGFSSAHDYATARLEMPWASFCRHHRLGDLWRTVPEARNAFLQGEVGATTLEMLSRRLGPGEVASWLPRIRGLRHREVEALVQPRGSARAEPSPPDPGYEVTRLSLPEPVHRYFEGTLALASAASGADLPPGEALEAMLAEASSAVTPDEDDEVARRRLGLRPKPVRPAHAPPGSAPPLRPPPLPTGTGARELDRALQGGLDRRRRWRLDLSDELLRLEQATAHRELGYASFTGFARAEIGLAPSTVHDHLAAARQRRRRDPVALAQAEGRLGDVLALELRRLLRTGHVPPSRTRPWVAFARESTVRRLRLAHRWVREQVADDLRRFQLLGCPPPDDTQLRALDKPLDELAAHPDLPSLEQLASARSTVLTLVLREDSARFLRSLWSGAQRELPPRAPRWAGLLSLAWIARQEWAQLVHRELRPTRWRILRRDRYRCRVPGCTRRHDLQVHHIRYRSHGGSDDPSNLVTLCAYHHRALHEGRLRIRGTASDLRVQLLGGELRYRNERRLNPPVPNAA